MYTLCILSVSVHPEGNYVSKVTLLLRNIGAPRGYLYFKSHFAP